MTSPPRLADILICVEYRRPPLGLQDQPIKTSLLVPSLLLQTEFKMVKTEIMRADHLSYQALMRSLTRDLNIPVNEKDFEIGYLQPGTPSHYLVIKSELTFHNAVCILQLALDQSVKLPRVTLFLWSLTPRNPVPRRFQHVISPEQMPQVASELPVQIPRSISQLTTVQKSEGSPPPSSGEDSKTLHVHDTLGPVKKEEMGDEVEF